MISNKENAQLEVAADDVHAQFASQFDPNSATYHGGGVKQAVPTGGARMPPTLAAAIESGVATDAGSGPAAAAALPAQKEAAYEALRQRREALGELKKVRNSCTVCLERLFSLQEVANAQAGIMAARKAGGSTQARTSYRVSDLMPSRRVPRWLQRFVCSVLV
jgi:hypothetical protein